MLIDQDVRKIFIKLSKSYPNPRSELKSKNNFTFLVSVVLSAQATDVSVNNATKNLFKNIKTPEGIIKLGEKNLKEYIKTIGLYNSKAKNIIALSYKLIKDFKSKIPEKYEDLISLPGVGNKTASVYQNVILKLPKIAVDTHVYRVSNRLGLVQTKTADQTQIELEKIVPKKWLMDAHSLLILHGRRVCKSQKPLCQTCFIKKNCLFGINILI
jgi:endonuclease-3